MGGQALALSFSALANGREMSREQTLAWAVQQGGERLDKYLLHKLPDRSRSSLQKLVADGFVLVNGEYSRASYKVSAGDEVQIRIPEVESGAPQAESIALNILYGDLDLLVINKPEGMVVHPAPGHDEGTLVNALLAAYPELSLEGGERPGIVHRLDRDTSGLILVARHAAAKRSLQAQFKQRTVTKTYLALVEGILEPSEGAIEAPIGRDPRSRKRMAVVSGGKPARTSYVVREHLRENSLVEAGLETGRTHQIRVHFAAIGHPVAGDTVYGRRQRPAGLQRQFLHAWQLTFELPGSGQPRTFEAPLPEDLQCALEALR